ncbi:GMC family oxidoreductase, partial [Micromonospora fluostatini]
MPPDRRGTHHGPPGHAHDIERGRAGAPSAAGPAVRTAPGPPGRTAGEQHRTGRLRRPAASTAGRHPARRRTVRAHRGRATVTDETVDVCVIGSGASGAIAAHFLCRQGHSVLILEEGGRVTPGDSLRGLEKTWQPALTPSPDGGLADSGRPWTAQALGGGMTLFGGIMFRYRKVDFDAGKYMSTDALDPRWPLSYHDLRPYYEEVERLVGVARADHADPLDPGSGPPRRGVR